MTRNGAASKNGGDQAPAAAGRVPFDLLCDAALPRLGEALDPELMGARLAAGFEQRAQGAAPRLRGCTIEEVHYRPGKHCGVLYRVRLEADSGHVGEEWLFGRLLPRELLRERHERAHAAVVAAGAMALVRSALEPVSLWDDPGMILWVFPNDPKLAGLRLVSDRSRVARRYAVERAAQGPLGSRNGVYPSTRWHAEFERVKYMPCKRCVLRYRLLPERAGAAASATLYAKAYPDGAAGAPYRLQRAAWAALRAQGSPVEIPEPLAHLEGDSVLWFEDWGGRGLLSLALERGWDELAERAAETLAAFHLARLPGLPAGPPPAVLMEGALAKGTTYASRVPAHARLMGAMLARLESRRPGSIRDVPRLPLHGAFRAEHVLVRGGRTAVVDLDGMAEGDPLIDVAEFVSSLEFTALSGADPELDAAGVSRRFLERYAEAVPWAVEPARLEWYALASLVGKMHGAVKRLALPTLAGLERHGAALAERWCSIGAWTTARRRTPGRASYRPAGSGAGARGSGVAR